MTKQKPRNPMDSQLLLHRPAVPVPEESANDPDVEHLNGRETVDHERALLREARRAERAEAETGMLAGLIRPRPKL